MTRLTFLEPATTRTYNGRMGLYQCACGNQVKHPIRKVNSGRILSCGCKRRDHMRDLANRQWAAKRAAS